jgi:hypothetical protein
MVEEKANQTVDILKQSEMLTPIYDKRSSQAMRSLAMQSGKNEWRTSEASAEKKAKELVLKAIHLQDQKPYVP